MTRFLAAFALGVTTGTIAALLLMARRGVPAGPTWDEPEDGVQPYDPYLAAFLADPNPDGKWDRIGTRIDRMDYLRTYWPSLVNHIQRTAELATGGGR